MSTGYGKANLETDIEDVAPKYGMQFGAARLPNDAIGATGIGMSHYRMDPGKRFGFGHRHREAEEVYVVLAGTGRAKLGDDIVDLTESDVLRVAPETIREFEAGPDGMTLLAAGHRVPGDGEMIQGFWTD